MKKLALVALLLTLARLSPAQVVLLISNKGKVVGILSENSNPTTRTTTFSSTDSRYNRIAKIGGLTIGYDDSRSSADARYARIIRIGTTNLIYDDIKPSNDARYGRLTAVGSVRIAYNDAPSSSSPQYGIVSSISPGNAPIQVKVALQIDGKGK